MVSVSSEDISVWHNYDDVWYFTLVHVRIVLLNNIMWISRLFLQPAKKTTIGSAHFPIPRRTFSLLHFASNLQLHLQTSKTSGYLKFVIIVRTHLCCYWGSKVTSEVKRSMGVATLRSLAKMLSNWQKILVRNLCYINAIIILYIYSA